MKVFFLKIAQWYFDHYDKINEYKEAFSFVTFLAIWGKPIFDLLKEYGLETDYGFFAVYGQWLIYIVKYIYPKWFPKQEQISPFVWTLRFVGNNVLAWTFGLIFTPLAVSYIAEKTLSILAIAMFVGAFYELGLKRILKYAYKLSVKEDLTIKEDGKENQV